MIIDLCGPVRVNTAVPAMLIDSLSMYECEAGAAAAATALCAHVYQTECFCVNASGSGVYD